MQTTLPVFYRIYDNGVIVIRIAASNAVVPPPAVKYRKGFYLYTGNSVLPDRIYADYRPVAFAVVKAGNT